MTKTNLINFASIAIVAVFAFTGCNRKDSVSANKVVLKVGDRELTLGQFRNELNQRVSQLDPLLVQTPRQLESIKEEVTETFVVQSLVENFAKDSGLVLKKETLDEEIKKTVKGYPDDLTFQRSLSEEGLTYADWQASLKKTLLQKVVLRSITKDTPKVTDQEKQTYYRENINRFKAPEQIDLRQIVLDSEASGKKIETDIRSGKSFPDLAKKYSISPEGKDGGSIGWIERGTFEPFDNLFDKPVGYKSALIKSTFGFHLMEVRGKKPARTLSYGEVSSKIESELAQQKQQVVYTKWLEEQLRKAKVFRDEELIKSLVVEVKQE